MPPFFKTSQVWVIEFLFDGRARRWLKAFPQGTDVPAEMARLLEDYYGRRQQLEQVRLATPEEEEQYIRGEVPVNQLCPTGRGPTGQI
ncbi:MAG: hypothetical protein KF796_10350 [Ramlibacter sp.]|nr:hypothetical protein [Ramlibacter sp.]